LWQQGAAVTDVIAGRASAQHQAGDEAGEADDARPGPATGEGAGIGIGIAHEPALDGLRGLAVAVVVVFHLDHLKGGFLGVDLFFVLSGFLITSLLLSEHNRRQAVDLGRFWVRRARRLLPALFVTLIGVSFFLLRLVPGPYRARYRDDALSTLLYVNNWQRMTSKVGYWELFSSPSPFDHMWSLAIEEQFYVFWPLVVLLVLGAKKARPNGPQRLGLVAAVGAAISLTLLWITYSPIDTNRAYFSTDTRIGPTLLGAALAVVAARRVRRDKPPTLTVELLGVLALAWMAWSVYAVDGLGSWYYRGGLITFALAALVVIHAVTGGPLGRVGRAVAVKPLALLGTISYGVYLWHWPVIVFFDKARTGIDGWTLDALRIAVTLAFSLSSFFLIERPIRRGNFSAAGSRRLLIGGTAVTLVIVLAAMWGTPVPTQATMLNRVPVEGSTRSYMLYPEPDAFPDSATRVLVVGDSGVQHLGPSLMARARESGVSVATSAYIMCTVVNPEGVSRQSDGRILRSSNCQDRRIDLWSNMVETYDPDIVVYYLANAGQLGQVRLDGEWVNDCDAPYDDYFEHAMADDLEMLGAGGAEVYLTTSPQPGVLISTSHERVACRNQTYQRSVDDVPGTHLIGLKTFVQDTIDRPDDNGPFFRDTLHFSGWGARAASEWLLPTIGAIEPTEAADPVQVANAGPLPDTPADP
jgi:peptidoglycan/LPS O-acetylase OafA/YrhL